MPCPNCRKPAKEAFSPFCSKRCQEVDLSRWFRGSYAVPVVEADEFSELDGEDETIPDRDA